MSQVRQTANGGERGKDGHEVSEEIQTEAGNSVRSTHNGPDSFQALDEIFSVSFALGEFGGGTH